MGKISMLAAAAAGYVLGARAGRERYDQIAQQAGKVWRDPRVQQRKDQAADQAKAAAGQAAEQAKSAAGQAADQAQHTAKHAAAGAQEKLSGSSDSSSSASGSGSAGGSSDPSHGVTGGPTPGSVRPGFDTDDPVQQPPNVTPPNPAS